jgi:hypothetical protein
MMQSFLLKLLEKKSVCDPVQKYQIRLNVFLFSFLEQKCPQFYPHDFLKNPLALRQFIASAVRASAKHTGPQVLRIGGIQNQEH